MSNRLFRIILAILFLAIGLITIKVYDEYGITGTLYWLGIGLIASAITALLCVLLVRMRKRMVRTPKNPYFENRSYQDPGARQDSGAK